MRSLLLPIIFLALSVAGYAQPKSSGSKKSGSLFGTFNVNVQQINYKQYVFTHFNEINGLASNIVRNIIQDSEGYIWLATLDGLQRYDGNRFVTFRHSDGDPYSLPVNEIDQIMMDRHNNLWVFADRRIGVFNRQNFRYTEFPIKSDTGKAQVRFMKPDKDNNCTAYVQEQGLFVFDNVSRSFSHLFKFDVPAGVALSDIVSAGKGHDYWLGCSTGLMYFNAKTKHLNYEGHNPDQIPYIDQLKGSVNQYSLYGVWNDTLWYCNWPMIPGAPFVNAFSMKSGVNKRYSVGNQFNFGYFEVSGTMRQQNGRIWAYGRTFLAELSPNADAPFKLVRNEYKDEQSIRFDLIYTMYEDRQHNLWVATENGVFLFNPDAQSFNSHNLLRPDGSGSVEGPSIGALQLKNKDFVIGSWGSGLYFYDSNFAPKQLPASLQKFTDPHAFWSLLQHSRTDKIWMGMQDGALLIYDPVTGAADHSFPEHIGSTIRQLIEDRNGNIWLGCQGGQVLKYNGGDHHKPESYTVVRKRDGALTQKLFLDKDGYVWAGTLMDGLFKYDPVTNKELAHITKFGPRGKALWNNSPCDMLQYDDTTLLVAGGALNFVDTRTYAVRQFTSDNGLPSNTVLCFERDNRGDLWVGMAHGLYRINLQKRIFSQYDRRDGISFDNFNPASAYKMRDGRLVFTTDHSFIDFNPDQVPAAAKPGNPAITNVRLSNRSLPVDSLTELSKVQLKYDNTSITIEFSSFNYLKQNKVHYHYMMEGVDKDWQESAELNQAVYNSLSPGEYTFMVKSENVDGVSSDKITTLHFVVKPPFWKAWWFYAALVLLAVLLLYLMDRERIQRLRALQRVRTQIAGDLHNEVNTTVSSIQVLSEMAKLRAEKDINRSIEYIDQISDKTRRMTIALDDMLWTINPANDSMKATLLRMQEFADAMHNREEALVSMTIEEKVQSLRLHMKTRHEFFIIFKEVLRHMAGYAQKAGIMVNIDLTGQKLSMKIQTVAAVPGLPTLSDIARRAQSIDAVLDVHSDAKAMSVILLVPIKSA